MIIDFHTHAFPDFLAPRAIGQLTANAQACGYKPMTDGTVEGLRASMRRVGIDRSVVCNIATTPGQVSKVNAFACSLTDCEDVIPLGSLHPQSSEQDMDIELDKLARARIPGIKIHPDYTHTELDSKAFEPILSRCEERGMLVVTHAGFDPVEPNHIHCTPYMVLRVMDRHPDLKLVVAHTGGFDCEEDVLQMLCGTRVYLDTSLSALRMQKSSRQGRLCTEILRRHDPDRILFATDTPWSDPVAEIAFIRNTGLSSNTMDRIFSQNAENLINSCIS